MLRMLLRFTLKLTTGNIIILFNSFLYFLFFFFHWIFLLVCDLM